MKNYDGEGSKHVTAKMNSCFFKLFRIYSSLLKMANIGVLYWSCTLGDRTQAWTENKNSSLCVYFHVLQTLLFHVMQGQQRNVLKSLLNMQKLLFNILNLCYLTFSFASLSLLPKPPSFIGVCELKLLGIQMCIPQMWLF